MRDLIVVFIVESKWERSGKAVLGSLTLIYDYGARGLLDRLTEIQQERSGNIVSTMHVHVVEHICLEVLALKGL